MSWFRRKKIDPPDQNHVGEKRSRDALRESEEKLREAEAVKAEIIKVADKSKELVKRNDTKKLNGEPA